MPDQPGRYDLVVSLLVLQHNPPPVIVRLIARFCRALRPGGIFYIQLPVSLYGYRFDLNAYLAAPPTHGLMEMHCLPRREILRIFAANGCSLLEASSEDDIGDIGRSYRFLGRKRGPYGDIGQAAEMACMCVSPLLEQK